MGLRKDFEDNDTVLKEGRGAGGDEKGFLSSKTVGFGLRFMVQRLGR